jgi:hypothetical protein
MTVILQLRQRRMIPDAALMANYGDLRRNCVTTRDLKAAVGA